MDSLFFKVILLVSELNDPSYFEAIWCEITKYRFFIYTVLLLIPIAYLIELTKYYFKVRNHVNEDTINLGQITVQGELGKILDPEQVALMLRSEFMAIQRCLANIGSEKVNSCPAHAASVDYYFFFSGIKEATDREGTVTHQNTVIPNIKGLTNKPKIQTNITLEFHTVKIPVSEIYRTIMQIIGSFRVPTRIKYNNSLIHISLITHKKYAKAVVYKSVGKKTQKKDRGKEEEKNYSLTCSAPFDTIDDINSLLRDIAFMVLKLHNEKTFQNTHWKSMRYLLDGFVEFSRFRNSGLLSDRNKAKDLFSKALAEDSENNLEAMYYLAVMLMVERTATSIEKAINYFNNALRTDNDKLKALINLGLSFCYSQSYHRLGKTDESMIQKANEALNKVQDYWEKRYNRGKSTNSTKTIKDNNFPLLPYMKGMIGFVKAGGIKKNTKEKKEILLDALKNALKASELDPFNSIFKNNVGWALMQLALAGVSKLPPGVISDENEENTALLAEQFFLNALTLNPGNKLTHANLALLYSIPYFIQKDKNEHYFLKSRFHGLKAIKLDANYINAYRDLCTTYLRYKKFEEAEEYFYKALEIAESPVKDAELFNEIIKEAKKNNAPEELIQKWSKPKPELFEPH